MPSSLQPDYVKLWTPQLRLYSDDAEVFKQNDVDYLLKCLADTLDEPRYVLHLDDWLMFTLGRAVVENIPAEAIIESRKLFLKVLFIRFQYKGGRDGEELAYKELELAQISHIHQYFRTFDDIEVPADFSWEQDLDRRETWRNDPEAGERESDWEDEDEDGDEDEDDRMDEDYAPDSDPPSDKDIDISDASDASDDEPEPTPPDLPSFVDRHLNLSALPTKASLTATSLSDIPPTHELLCRWIKNINDFFYTNADASKKLDPEAVVLDLVAMRGLKSAHRVLVSSMLCKKIALPGNLLETSHPDIEQSFRFHDWRLSYAELICDWVRESFTLEQYTHMQRLKKPDPEHEYEFSVDDVQELLNFISSRPRMQPWGLQPNGSFPLRYSKIEGWDAEKVYRRLMELPLFKNDPDAHRSFLSQTLDSRFSVVINETADHHTFIEQIQRELYRPSPKPGDMESDTESSNSEASDSSSRWDAAAAARTSHLVPEKLSKTKKRRLRKKEGGAAILAQALAEEKKNLQRRGHRAKREAMGKADVRIPKRQTTRDECPYCADRPMKERCIRILYVKRRHLIGGALTCAPAHDRLDPKPPPKPKDGEPPKPVPEIKYYHPFKDLKMRLVKFRKAVYEQCGKDIVRLVRRQQDGEEEIVGGIHFKPFSEKTLARLVNNHRLVKVRAIRRRDMMQRWLYGTMTGNGSGQPKGGRKGSVYGPYACHRGDTPDDIKALFRGAADADAMIEVGNTIAPGLKKELSDLTAESGVNYLGRTGVVNFTCTNYISCIHPDINLSLWDLRHGLGKKDGLGGLTPCGTLEKSGCGPNEYNFAYVRWGVVLRTMANTVWVFNARHEHGTVMPARSTICKRRRRHSSTGTASTTGIHVTTPASSIARGQKISRIRCGYNLRPGVI
ncbi:hypothetical protein MVEN_02437100 [Mycena venus]|uniref:Uncharacterized protein n=1 Tax=Mycena venus TaxID=2733690 RepID=A0A8H7CB80_9AGAR|nr:hypothetical protein MVEN_02437100 [Mycena venus]